MVLCAAMITNGCWAAGITGTSTSPSCARVCDCMYFSGRCVCLSLISFVCVSCLCLSGVQHHCRFCGDLYCSKCSPSAVPSLRQGYIDPVRLCEDCRTVVAKDNEFIQKHLPVLVTGELCTLWSCVSVDCRLVSLPIAHSYWCGQ